LGIDEQKIDCKRAAIDEDSHIYDQADQKFGLDCLEQCYERDDEDQVIGEEAE
jgi:hypothetical protein